MDNLQKFKDAARTASEQFLKIDPGESIKVVTHFDCDGICAGSILVKALIDQNRKYSLSIVPGLTEEFLQELPTEDYQYYVDACRIARRKLIGKIYSEDFLNRVEKTIEEYRHTHKAAQ